MKQVEITSKIIGRGGSTTSASPSLDLSGYALISDLLNYVTISGNEDVTGLHDFVNGLKVGGLPITKKQDDVVYLDANLVVRGGITMYGDGDGGSSVPLYSTLGSLLNVDESNDSVASVDRVLFQSAGSNVWSWKALSEIGGGSSGGSVSGDYLPLSGGTLTGTLNTQFIRPSVNAAYQCGTSTLRWDNVYSVYGNFSNSITINGSTAIHAGNISSYNAGSATKLQTPRTIWGQSFDGTANVSGGLSSVGKITYTNASELTMLSITNGNYPFSMVYKVNQTKLYNVDFIGTWGSTNSISFGCGGGGNTVDAQTSWMTIVKGNVGIGTTSPAYKLDVNGSFGTTSAQVGSIFLGEQNEINSTGTRLWINFKGNAQLFLGNNGYPVIVGTYANQAANIQDTLNHAPFSVFGTIFGYRYGKKASGAAFMFDKPGSNYTGIGADETTDTIYFGACNKDGDWVSYNQIWKFGGSIECGLIVCGALKIWDTNVIDAVSGSGVHLNYYGSSDVTFCKGGGTTIAYGNLLTHGGITMYSDIRKKTKLQDVELSLSQIANAPLIEHYYNSDQNKTTHVGSIAQYWAGLNDWFCKLDSEGFYTMEIQNCALASAISIARELVKYESKTDRTIRKMKQRIQELEDEVELLKKGV